MRTNYQRGRDKEYKIVNKLKENGFDICFRSAGSHSPIDIVAISKELKQVRFIQCKPKNFSKSAKLNLQKEYEWLNDRFLCMFEVE